MDAYETFIKKYPSYENNLLDKVRKEQFPQLEGVCYADWTGAALPSRLLLESHFDFLKNNLLGNPHSHHGPSATAMHEINETRRAILDFFKADPGEYDVIFTQNATKAIEILENYLFEGGEILLTTDNHNSVNGLREIVKRKGGVVRYSPINEDLTINEERLQTALRFPRSCSNKLFCYPAKSNYVGTKHSLDWICEAQSNGWDVLLDAAAFSANNRLDLSVVKPDFVPISFYKIFGYPTGIGCLIIKKSKYGKLHKKWFSGGSILLVGVMLDFYALESRGYARFEDGTVNFGNIPAIKNGLEFFTSLGSGISDRVISIASWLHDELNGMRYGDAYIKVHSLKGCDTVTFSVIKGDETIDAWTFEQAVNKDKVFVRTGCFCNPGVNERIFNYKVESFAKLYNSAISQEEITIEELRKYSGNDPIGAIRTSFGFANNFNDVAMLASSAAKFLRNVS